MQKDSETLLIVFLSPKVMQNSNTEQKLQKKYLKHAKNIVWQTL
jgi:hypothetical protein